MRTLNCHDFNERLNEILDQREIPTCDRALIAHAASCPLCDRRLTTQQSILELVESPKRTVVRDAPPANTQRSRRHEWNWLIVVATAACIAVAYSLFQPAHQSSIQPNAVAHSAQPVEATAGAVDTEQETHDVSEPNESFVATMGVAVESWNQFLATRTENTEWLEPVASPIRPLTESMTSPFNVLRQTMPRVRREEPRGELLDSAKVFLAKSQLA